MSLLSLSDIAASYGETQALFGVDLTIGEGEVVALMGRNGMGKSTTIKVICRMLDHHQGEIRFAGESLSGLASHQAAGLGLGLVPEGRRCFPGLTVLENLQASARKGVWDFSRVSKLFPRLAERTNQIAASLSGGEQQMLAIGRALMTNPKLLILDEATEGLAPVIRQEIWQVIGQLKQDSDMAILIIDKTLAELRRMADSAVILEKGRSVWRGPMAELGDDVAHRYLGV